MKYSSRKAVFIVLLLIILLAYTVGCEFPQQGDVEPQESELIEIAVALTVDAVALETAAAHAIMTYVSETVTAMAMLAEPNAEVSQIPIELIQTSVAETLTAEPVAPTFSPPTSLPHILMRVKGNLRAAYVRAGPNACFEVVAILPRGQDAFILGRNNTHSWYQVQLGSGATGWLWSEFADLIDSETKNQIPLVTSIPACPTRTPVHTPTNIPPTTAPIQPGETLPPADPATPMLPTPTPDDCAYPYCPPPPIVPTPTPLPCGYWPCP